MISIRTIRHGTLDRPIQEEEKWQTQSTVLTMVFSTGIAPQEFRQILNRVRQMSHLHPHPSCSWQTLSTLSSDHLPILIRLQMKTPSNPGLRRTYVNLKKANWDRYRQEIEAALSKHSLPRDCQRDETIFRTVLLKAAPHHIPTRRHRRHEEPVPAEILDMMNRGDDLRKRDPTSPELPILNKAIQNRICVHKRQKWRDFVETMDQKTELTKLWRTIK